MTVDEMKRLVESKAGNIVFAIAVSAFCLVIVALLINARWRPTRKFTAEFELTSCSLLVEGFVDVQTSNMTDASIRVEVSRLIAYGTELTFTPKIPSIGSFSPSADHVAVVAFENASSVTLHLPHQSTLRVDAGDKLSYTMAKETMAKELMTDVEPSFDIVFLFDLNRDDVLWTLDESPDGVRVSGLLLEYMASKPSLEKDILDGNHVDLIEGTSAQLSELEFEHPLQYPLAFTCKSCIAFETKGEIGGHPTIDTLSIRPSLCVNLSSKDRIGPILCQALKLENCRGKMQLGAKSFSVEGASIGCVGQAMLYVSSSSPKRLGVSLEEGHVTSMKIDNIEQVPTWLSLQFTDQPVIASVVAAALFAILAFLAHLGLKTIGLWPSDAPAA